MELRGKGVLNGTDGMLSAARKLYGFSFIRKGTESELFIVYSVFIFFRLVERSF